MLGGLAVHIVWRYLERGLDWLEPRAGKKIPRFGVGVLRRVERNPYLVLVLMLPLGLTLIIWSAAKGWWITVGVGLGSGLGGFMIGSALRQAQERKWIPQGMEHVVLGLVFLILAGLLPALMAFEVSPWWGFAAIGIAPAGIVELWHGVQMLSAAGEEPSGVLARDS